MMSRAANFPTMNRFALFLLMGFCSWCGPLAANDAPVDSHSLAERLRTLFAPRPEPVAETPRYDSRMVLASKIASQHAFKKPTWRCWHYVKEALLGAGLVTKRPVSPWAKQAGDELCGTYGFKKLRLTDPLRAPVGAVIVYGGADAGHVELRTASGFVSDFISPTPYPRPLIGIYVKEI